MQRAPRLHGPPDAGQARGLAKVCYPPRQGPRQRVQEAAVGHQEEDRGRPEGAEETEEEQGRQRSVVEGARFQHARAHQEPQDSPGHREVRRQESAHRRAISLLHVRRQPPPRPGGGGRHGVRLSAARGDQQEARQSHGRSVQASASLGAGDQRHEVGRERGLHFPNAPFVAVVSRLAKELDVFNLVGRILEWVAIASCRQQPQRRHERDALEK